MEIITKHGKFNIVKNHREAFEKEDFEKRYIPEVYNKFKYIVGDVSSGILRLKGFNKNKKSSFFYRNIPIYLNESCHMNIAYFILEREENDEQQQ